MLENYFSPLQTIGLFLRNALYLPWFSKKVDPDYILNQRLSQKIAESLMTSAIFPTNEYDPIKHAFFMRDIEITIEGPISQIFTIRLFESKEAIGGKKLRMILFSFNENEEGERGQIQRKWNPLTIQALSKSPILILKALKEVGISVDSLVTTSLGNVILQGLNQEEDFKILPSTLIMNRGFTSTKKVSFQLFSFPLNYLLYGAALLTGWNADPEKELISFLIRESQSSQPFQERKVIILEARKDFYFSQQGRFDLDTHTKIAALGHKVFRGNFFTFPFQARAHHALSLDHLVNNSVTDTLADSAITLSQEEKVSSAIARDVLLSGDGEYHTCFYICGNDGTLDIGTVRDAIPLLSAYIKEAQMRTVADGHREALAS